MIIAVIGANGFVGTRLVESLHLGAHHAVVPVVRRPSALALNARFAPPGRIADALDPAALAAALAGCDAVIHVALGDPRQIAAMPDALCAAASAARVRRVVYLSSAAVHGHSPGDATDESTALSTLRSTDYARAKIRAERAFFRACARHRLDGFALRPGIVLGARSRWIADLAADLRAGRAWLLRDGRAVCNTCQIDNLVAAIAACLSAPAAHAGPYLVGDAEHVTWHGLTHDVARSLGVAPAAIHRVATAPSFPRPPAEHLARLLSGPVARRALPLFPSSLKQLAKRLASVALARPAAADAWTLPTAAAPRITEELAHLQQNTWQLSSARAARLLGYQPVVDYRTGLARALAWLAFAEGRA